MAKDRAEVHGEFPASPLRAHPAPRAALKDHAIETAAEELPALNTAHMLSMTDDTGILQHAIFSIPNTSEGYTTDDNARALIVSALLDEAPEVQAGRQCAIVPSLPGISMACL